MKKSKAIVLKDLKTRLSIPIDESIIIKPPSDLIQNKKYFQDRIKELEESNRKYKDIINSLSGRRDELKYLQEFRNKFSAKCPAHLIRKTIIQCTESIRKGSCTFSEQCIERKRWNNLLIV